MTQELAELVLRKVERAGARWPLAEDRDAIKAALRGAAFRESDKEALKLIADWRKATYLIDPLPEKISQAYADLLFGEDPSIKPSSVKDAERMDDLVETSDFFAELRWAEEICCSEGDVWWRIFRYPDVADHPLIEFHSRDSVVPHWIGPRLVAIAFVSEFPAGDTDPGRSENEPDRIIWRHLEIHTKGRVENRLYRGTRDTIGRQELLTAHTETALLGPVWAHGLPGMLAGRIPNKRGRDRRVGISEYKGIEDYLLLLNEAVNIGAGNARLTLKRRVVAPLSAIQAPPSTETVDMGDGSMRQFSRPTFDTDEDVFIAEQLDKTLGDGSGDPFKVLEYSFDADALILYKRDLTISAANRVGLTAQFMAIEGMDGTAETGTALRVRLMPTTLAGEGKGRFWDAALPQMLMLAQLLDAGQKEGDVRGFAIGWDKAGTPPAVERTDPLPTDEGEEVSRHSLAVSSEIESPRTAIEDLHPDWDEDRVDEELEAIREHRQSSRPPVPAFPGAGGPGVTGEPDEEPEDADTQ